MTKKVFAIHRILNTPYLSNEEIQLTLNRGEDFSKEVVQLGGKPLEFSLEGQLLDSLANYREDDPKFVLDHSFEAKLAVAIYEGLTPLRQAAEHLLRDPGIWAWLSLYPLRHYVIHRWCGGRNSFGGPLSVDKCSYFLTTDSLQGQARCGVRRLWVAASTCQRSSEKNALNEANVEILLRFSDLYTGIFERMLGLDPDLALEVGKQFVTMNEDERRRGLRLLGAILSTTLLESLDDVGEKKALVAAAKAEATNKLL
jgi:hypothetical protein